MRTRGGPTGTKCRDVSVAHQVACEPFSTPTREALSDFATSAIVRLCTLGFWGLAILGARNPRKSRKQDTVMMTGSKNALLEGMIVKVFIIHDSTQENRALQAISSFPSAAP